MEAGFILIIAMLGFSAFFSGLEIAFISANKLRVELKSQQGALWAKIVSDYFRKPSRFISTILVGNNIALVIYGIAMEEFLRNTVLPDMSPLLALLCATAISTVVVLITAEYLPKALFRLNPGGMLSILIFPFQVFYYLMWPVVQFTLWLSKKLLNTFTQGSFSEENPVFTRMDLDHFISEHGSTETDEKQEVDTEILRNALDFGKVKVRDCMVPRTEIEAVELTSSINDLKKAFIESNHSKILIYKENIDNIIGYVHHLEMFKKPTSIRSVLMPIIITNESKPANELLNEFTLKRKSVALVVDEFGGTAGIVTVEDIIEEIFGEIEDEHDKDEGVIEKQLSETVFLFSAKLEVEYLNQHYDFKLPEGDYETLGGLVMTVAESIPEIGEKIYLDGYEFIIREAGDHRIDVVELHKL